MASLNNKGFTLVEVAIVTVIALILIFLVVSVISGAANDPDFEKTYCEAQKYQAVKDLPAMCLEYYGSNRSL